MGTGVVFPSACNRISTKSTRSILPKLWAPPPATPGTRETTPLPERTSLSHNTLKVLDEQSSNSEPGPTPDTLPIARPARSLYIHIPFCFHKCHYCDFYSIVDQQDRAAEFTQCLCKEIAASAPWARSQTRQIPLNSIFVGGGTPTLLPPNLWKILLKALHAAFDLSQMGPNAQGEFSVECNPETATPELMQTLAQGGVNRLSIGAQSFNQKHLKALERWHDPANVARTIALANAAGIMRTSLDLIYAIPGQSIADAISDIDTAANLGVEHISAYSLTYEPGTALTARRARGELTPIDEDTDAAMMQAVAHRLKTLGYRRYETSNFALPGAECRHNLTYWHQRDWIAVGPSASAHLAGHRWKNIPRLATYLSALGSDQPCPVRDLERPNQRRALAERIMTGLRLSDGLDAASILASASRIDPDLPAVLITKIKSLRFDRLLKDHGPRRLDRWILTQQGTMLADGIAADLMALVDP